MELGIGHHGEPGIEITKLETARQIAERVTGVLIPDLPFEKGDELVILLSGLGATPVMELYILYGSVHRIFTHEGMRVRRSYVGNYFTSLDMAGVTLTVMRLDDEMKSCIEYEADSVGLKQFAR
jgi:dihydroxyacetone kinase-like protein